MESQNTSPAGPTPVVLINFFEVPSSADDGFVSLWSHQRDFLAEQPGFISAQLHKVLTDGSPFRYVNVALWQSPAAFQQATTQPRFAQAKAPFPFHAALYRVAVDEQSAPAEDSDVIVINPFEAPSAAGPTFIAGWRAAADALRPQPGYVTARLHQSVTPDARFGFVNVARWRSEDDFRAAVSSEAFRSLPAARVANHPALYRPLGVPAQVPTTL